MSGSYSDTYMHMYICTLVVLMLSKTVTKQTHEWCSDTHEYIYIYVCVCLYVWIERMLSRILSKDHALLIFWHIDIPIYVCKRNACCHELSLENAGCWYSDTYMYESYWCIQICYVLTRTLSNENAWLIFGHTHTHTYL